MKHYIKLSEPFINRKEQSWNSLGLILFFCPNKYRKYSRFKAAIDIIRHKQQHAELFQGNKLHVPLIPLSHLQPFQQCIWIYISHGGSGCGAASTMAVSSVLFFLSRGLICLAGALTCKRNEQREALGY